MDDRLHLSIAGVHYTVGAPPGFTPLAPDAAQSAFAVCDRSGRDGIDVDLVAGREPPPAAWQVLLSHGDGWSIRHNGAQRSLCIGATAGGRPAHLVACWTQGVPSATVYCAAERLIAASNRAGGSSLAGYPIDQVLLMYHLAPRRGLLVHAAGMVIDGQALVCPGVSGAGKSTLTREFLAERSPGLLSDDRIIVRLLDGAYHAFGTPWPGDAGVAVNAGAPLAAILFPARGAGIRIRALSPQEALNRLLPATSILWFEPDLLTDQLKTCERVLSEIPAFELAWSPGQPVVQAVQELVAQL